MIGSARKGKKGMKTMDIVMIFILAVCFGSMKLLADWCEKQVGTTTVYKEEEK